MNQFLRNRVRTEEHKVKVERKSKKNCRQSRVLGHVSSVTCAWSRVLGHVCSVTDKKRSLAYADTDYLWKEK